MVCVTGGASGHISSPPVTSPHWSCHSSLVTGQQNLNSPSRLSEGCPFQIYLHLDYEQWHDFNPVDGSHDPIKNKTRKLAFNVVHGAEMAGVSPAL